MSLFFAFFGDDYMVDREKVSLQFIRSQQKYMVNGAFLAKMDVVQRCWAQHPKRLHELRFEARKDGVQDKILMDEEYFFVRRSTMGLYACGTSDPDRFCSTKYLTGHAQEWNDVPERVSAFFTFLDTVAIHEKAFDFFTGLQDALKPYPFVQCSFHGDDVHKQFVVSAKDIVCLKDNAIIHILL